MNRKRRSFNPKRCIATNLQPIDLEKLAKTVSYGGNPEHKRNPGDFHLTPPASPRRDKTLCDAAGIFERSVALSLLQEGIRRGLISQSDRNSFPQNIWAVSLGGIALEAQLENASQGTYHGYPMPVKDPFREKVIDLWNSNE